jgi:ankyrin repeat protein
LLLAAGADLESKGDGGFTPLFIAAQERQLPVVKALLAAGANKNAQAFDGGSPLYVSAQSGYTGIVEALLAAGADTEARTLETACECGGQTPLFLAAQHGYLVIVKALLAAGANPNARANDGETPVYIAAQQGHVAVVNALLAARADADAATTHGDTPLIRAASDGKAGSVKALLAHGCNVDAINTFGSTALMCATAAVQDKVTGAHECVRVLMRKGGADASIITRQHGNKTAAELAAEMGCNDETLHELRRVCATCAKTQGQIKGKLLKCSSCVQVYYCSSECPHVDWPKHKGQCARLKAAAAEAAASLPPGATKDVSHCMWCSKTSGVDGAALCTCSRCKAVRYCSRDCQVKDFPRYKRADGCGKK